MIACCIRLKRTSSGPGGLTQIAKVLFYNNVDYMAGVETCNFIEMVMIMGWSFSLPPLHMTSIAIQIVVGLQMLIGEQEAVYSPSCSRVGYGTAYSAGSSSYSRPTTSNSSFGRGQAMSYVKRPGTANTVTEVGGPISDYRGRKGTFSSIGSMPYVKPQVNADELPPDVPPKSTYPYNQCVEMSIDMVANRSHAVAPPPEDTRPIAYEKGTIRPEW